MVPCPSSVDFYSGLEHLARPGGRQHEAAETVAKGKWAEVLYYTLYRGACSFTKCRSVGEAQCCRHVHTGRTYTHTCQTGPTEVVGRPVCLSVWAPPVHILITVNSFFLQLRLEPELRCAAVSNPMSMGAGPPSLPQHQGSHLPTYIPARADVTGHSTANHMNVRHDTIYVCMYVCMYHVYSLPYAYICYVWFPRISVRQPETGGPWRKCCFYRRSLRRHLGSGLLVCGRK